MSWLWSVPSSRLLAPLISTAPGGGCCPQLLLDDVSVRLVLSTIGPFREPERMSKKMSKEELNVPVVPDALNAIVSVPVEAGPPRTLCKVRN
jgi:hypothetical protein